MKSQVLFNMADSLGKLAGSLARTGGFDHVGITCIEGRKVMCVIGTPTDKDKLDEAGMIEVIEELGKYFMTVARAAKEGKLKPEEISKDTQYFPNTDWFKENKKPDDDEQSTTE